MSTVNISEIERNPGAYLARARAGEIVLITENDRPVAELKGFRQSSQPSNSSDPVYEYFRGRISDVGVPMPWKEEGVDDPTSECRDYGLRIACDLYTAYALIPYRVAATKQGGIFLGYKQPQSGRTLGIEIDNDLDTVGVVANDKDVLESGVFEGDEVDRLLAVFRG